VRIHDITHPCFAQDIATIVTKATAKRLAYLVVPKVDSVSDVTHAIDAINAQAKKHGRKNLPIHVLIETHGALRDVHAIAALLIETHGALRDVHAIAALPQVECLSFGIMDFVSAHYGAVPGTAMRSPGQFTHPLVTRAKLEIAAACHAHGKVPSHNVTTEIKDTSVVASDATRASGEFGYTRMWSIHPNQIKPILKALAPRSSEVNEAAAILSEAFATQWGPIQYNGKLHDRASYRYYWAILQRAKASGMPVPESAGSFL